MVLMVLLSFPLLLGGSYVLKDLPMAWLGVASLGAPLLFVTAEASLYPRKGWWRRVAWLPLLMMLGVGVAVSNTLAVLAAVLDIRSPFQRTPKMGNTHTGNPLKRRMPDTNGLGWTTVAEIALSAYAFFAAVLTLEQSNLIGATFLSAYGLGFAWVVCASIWEASAPWIYRMLTPKRWNVRME
jgi:hypothetical protein